MTTASRSLSKILAKVARETDEVVPTPQQASLDNIKAQLGPQPAVVEAPPVFSDDAIEEAQALGDDFLSDREHTEQIFDIVSGDFITVAKPIRAPEQYTVSDFDEFKQTPVGEFAAQTSTGQKAQKATGDAARRRVIDEFRARTSFGDYRPVDTPAIHKATRQKVADYVINHHAIDGYNSVDKAGKPKYTKAAARFKTDAGKPGTWAHALVDLYLHNQVVRNRQNQLAAGNTQFVENEQLQGLSDLVSGQQHTKASATVKAATQILNSGIAYGDIGQLTKEVLNDLLVSTPTSRKKAREALGKTAGPRKEALSTVAAVLGKRLRQEAGDKRIKIDEAKELHAERNAKRVAEGRDEIEWDDSLVEFYQNRKSLHWGLAALDRVFDIDFGGNIGKMADIAPDEQLFLELRKESMRLDVATKTAADGVSKDGKPYKGINTLLAEQLAKPEPSKTFVAALQKELQYRASAGTKPNEKRLNYQDIRKRKEAIDAEIENPDGSPKSAPIMVSLNTAQPVQDIFVNVTSRFKVANTPNPVTSKPGRVNDDVTLYKDYDEKDPINAGLDEKSAIVRSANAQMDLVMAINQPRRGTYQAITNAEQAELAVIRTHTDPFSPERYEALEHFYAKRATQPHPIDLNQHPKALYHDPRIKPKVDAAVRSLEKREGRPIETDEFDHIVLNEAQAVDDRFLESSTLLIAADNPDLAGGYSMWVKVDARTRGYDRNGPLSFQGGEASAFVQDVIAIQKGTPVVAPLTQDGLDNLKAAVIAFSKYNKSAPDNVARWAKWNEIEDDLIKIGRDPLNNRNLLLKHFDNEEAYTPLSMLMDFARYLDNPNEPFLGSIPYDQIGSGPAWKNFTFGNLAAMPYFGMGATSTRLDAYQQLAEDMVLTFFPAYVNRTTSATRKASAQKLQALMADGTLDVKDYEGLIRKTAKMPWMIGDYGSEAGGLEKLVSGIWNDKIPHAGLDETDAAVWITILNQALRNDPKWAPSTAFGDILAELGQGRLTRLQNEEQLAAQGKLGGPRPERPLEFPLPTGGKHRMEYNSSQYDEARSTFAPRMRDDQGVITGDSPKFQVQYTDLKHLSPAEWDRSWRALIANFTHSIDASFKDFLIVEMQKIAGYAINRHDSFRVPANMAGKDFRRAVVNAMRQVMAKRRKDGSAILAADGLPEINPFFYEDMLETQFPRGAVETAFGNVSDVAKANGVIYRDPDRLARLEQIFRDLEDSVNNFDANGNFPLGAGN